MPQPFNQAPDPGAEPTGSGPGSGSPWVPKSFGGSFDPTDPSTLPGMSGMPKPPDPSQSMGGSNGGDLGAAALLGAAAATQPQPGTTNDPLMKRRREDPYKIYGVSPEERSNSTIPPTPLGIFSNYMGS